MHRKGSIIYREDITISNGAYPLWVKLLFAAIIAIVLLLGLLVQDLSALFPSAPMEIRHSLDDLDTHCLGDEPPDDYQLSGLIITLSDSGFPTVTLSTRSESAKTKNDWVKADTPSIPVVAKNDRSIYSTPTSLPRQPSTNLPSINPSPDITQPFAEDSSQPATMENSRANQNTDPFNQWIMRQPPDHYTMQILSGRNRDALTETANQYLNETPHAIYARQLDGKPWYSLIVGSYASAAAAKQAMKTLSKALKIQSAWPKKFAGIHAQIQ